MIASAFNPFSPHSVKSVIQLFSDEVILASATDNIQPVFHLENVLETAGWKIMGSLKKIKKIQKLAM